MNKGRKKALTRLVLADRVKGILRANTAYFCLHSNTNKWRNKTK